MDRPLASEKQSVRTLTVAFGPALASLLVVQLIGRDRTLGSTRRLRFAARFRILRIAKQQTQLDTVCEATALGYLHATSVLPSHIWPRVPLSNVSSGLLPSAVKRRVACYAARPCDRVLCIEPAATCAAIVAVSHPATIAIQVRIALPATTSPSDASCRRSPCR